MSNELSITAGLADQINAEHAAAKSAAVTALDHAMKCGRLLAEARQQIPHGRWLDWLAENVQFSARTAQIYQRLHERRDAIGNAQRVAHLPVREAVRLLAEPKPVKPAPAPRPTPDDDAKYLPAKGEYLMFDQADASGCFVLVAPSQHAGYFYVTRAVLDCQGVVSLEGMKRPLLASHAAGVVRKWVSELRDAEDGFRFTPLDDGLFGPLPWEYNNLLYTSVENWIQYGLLGKLGAA